MYFTWYLFEILKLDDFGEGGIVVFSLNQTLNGGWFGRRKILSIVICRGNNLPNCSQWLVDEEECLLNRISFIGVTFLDF